MPSIVSITRRKARRAYLAHRACSRWRGIEFFLTFEQWWKIWWGSGHWDERGKFAYQYVMARFGDKGPYAVGNVKIITVSENVREAHVGRKRSASCQKKMNMILKNAWNVGAFDDRNLRGEANGRAKLNASLVIKIRSEYPKYNTVELSRKYGVSDVVIGNVVHKRSWRHVA